MVFVPTVSFSTVDGSYKKSSENTAVYKIITNWFPCSWTQLTPDIILWLQTTCATLKSLRRKKCLNNSLHHLTPGPLPLHLALLSASACRALSWASQSSPPAVMRDLLWLGTAQLPLFTSDLQRANTTHSQPGRRSPSPSSCQRAQAGLWTLFFFQS